MHSRGQAAATFELANSRFSVEKSDARIDVANSLLNSQSQCVLVSAVLSLLIASNKESNSKQVVYRFATRPEIVFEWSII